MSQLEVIGKNRQLGHTEQLFLAYHNTNNTLIYISVNVIESKNEIKMQRVVNAFQQTSKMNFLMHACVKSDTDNNNAPCFRPISEQRLEEEKWMRIDEISLSDEEDWEREIPKFMKEKIDYENGPLWRVVWAKIENNENKYILFFICSHIIIDGKSGFNLICNQIIPFLNGEKSECNPIYFGKSQEEIFYGFSKHEMHLSNRPVSFSVRILGNILSWKSYLSRLIWGEPQPCPIHHHYEKFVIEEKVSQTFIKICKSRGKTVHSVLMVLLQQSLDEVSENFSGDILPKSKELFFMVDERKFNRTMCDPNTMPLGNYNHINLHEMGPITLDNQEKLSKWWMK